MGFPASGVEGMYRNSIIDVAQFLIEKHQGNFMIYNLSSRKYDYSLFNEQVKFKKFYFLKYQEGPLIYFISGFGIWISRSSQSTIIITIWNCKINALVDSSRQQKCSSCSLFGNLKLQKNNIQFPQIFKKIIF